MDGEEEMSKKGNATDTLIMLAGVAAIGYGAYYLWQQNKEGAPASKPKTQVVYAAPDGTLYAVDNPEDVNPLSGDFGGLDAPPNFREVEPSRDRTGETTGNGKGFADILGYTPIGLAQKFTDKDFLQQGASNLQTAASYTPVGFAVSKFTDKDFLSQGLENLKTVFGYTPAGLAVKAVAKGVDNGKSLLSNVSSSSNAPNMSTLSGPAYAPAPVISSSKTSSGSASSSSRPSSSSSSSAKKETLPTAGRADQTVVKQNGKYVLVDKPKKKVTYTL